MPEFHETPMGRKFFQGDFPEMVRQLERIANYMEKTIDVDCKRCGTRMKFTGDGWVCNQCGAEVVKK